MSFASFRREVDVNCALLDCYAASSGNSLPTFRGNLSVPSSRLKKRWDRQVVPKRRLGITTTKSVIVHVSNSPHNRIIINSPKTPLNAAISICSSPMQSGDGFAAQFESGHLIRM